MTQLLESLSFFSGLEVEADRLSRRCASLGEECEILTIANQDTEKAAARMVQSMGDLLKNEVGSVTSHE